MSQTAKPSNTFRAEYERTARKSKSSLNMDSCFIEDLSIVVLTHVLAMLADNVSKGKSSFTIDIRLKGGSRDHPSITSLISTPDVDGYEGFRIIPGRSASKAFRDVVDVLLDQRAGGRYAYDLPRHIVDSWVATCGPEAGEQLVCSELRYLVEKLAPGRPEDILGRIEKLTSKYCERVISKLEALLRSCGFDGAECTGYQFGLARLTGKANAIRITIVV